MSFSSPREPWDQFSAPDYNISTHLLRDAEPYSTDITSRVNSVSDFDSIRSRLSARIPDPRGSYQEIDHGPAPPREESYRLVSLRPNGSKNADGPPAISDEPDDFHGHLAVGQPGWWRRQMLVDRSLRSMAALTSIFAIVMIAVCAACAKDFINRGNPNSTSVGGLSGENCNAMEGRNAALHLLINVSATMILGMSNTYQQLVTSLRIDELRWALCKRGESRVGTNSPSAINDKRTGKLTSWLAWLLLVFTSLPVHFLANSIIGPSLLITPPHNIKYFFVDGKLPRTINYLRQYQDQFGCWTAFRTGRYHYSRDPGFFNRIEEPSNGHSTVLVTYNATCAAFQNATTDINLVTKEFHVDHDTVGDCSFAAVNCEFIDPEDISCRLNFRMQAGLTLAGCLLIKAIFMILFNLRGRRSAKSHCLTFGDVLVAASLDPGARIRNECMVNASDGYRHQTSHTCHKHCKDQRPSPTGDNLGHCQKCDKFNTVDKAADLLHPTMTMKYKKSLISNLGVTAVTQMVLLMFASAGMVSASIALAATMTKTAAAYNYGCDPTMSPSSKPEYCSHSLGVYLTAQSGAWGGFNSSVHLTKLPGDSLASEQLSFAISNGAQLLYSMLYLLLIYNVTLIIMEHEWGTFEKTRRRPRCTIVEGDAFEQSYLLQLPKRVIYPAMAVSSVMHWLLGQAISTTEVVWSDPIINVSHSQYSVVYATYPVWLSTILMLSMTSICWWAFTYKREGFMPMMYGSIRTCCAAATELNGFTREGIQWGDLGMGAKYRHAGFSSEEVGEVVPAELYSGRDASD